MKCRQCGSEIADNALVCYRCGTATSEPKYKPPAARKRSSGNLVTAVLALVLAVLCAMYVTEFGDGGASSGLRWAIVVVAASIIAVRVMGRRVR
jgi:zinc ribbon protein